jgi:hypothetical protein
VEAEQFEPFIATQPQLVNEVAESIDKGEVLRYLGYPIGRVPSVSIETLTDWKSSKEKGRSYAAG